MADGKQGSEPAEARRPEVVTTAAPKPHWQQIADQEAAQQAASDRAAQQQRGEDGRFVEPATDTAGGEPGDTTAAGQGDADATDPGADGSADVQQDEGQRRAAAGKRGPTAEERISELTRDKAAAERQRDQANLKASYWEKIEAGQAPTPEEIAAAGRQPAAQQRTQAQAQAADDAPYDGTDAGDPQPTRAKFTNTDTGEVDEDGYLLALQRYAYRVERRIEQHEAARKRDQAQAQAAQAAAREKEQEVARNFTAGMAQAREQFPDWDAAIAAADGNLTEEAQQAIMECDMGAHVAYYLATHPEELAELGKEPMRAQLRRIGEINAEQRGLYGKRAQQNGVADSGADASPAQQTQQRPAPRASRAAPPATDIGTRDGGGGNREPDIAEIKKNLAEKGVSRPRVR